MKRILSIGVLFLMMCIGLTGCSIQLDDEDIKTFEKMKDSANITINGKNVNTNDLMGVYNQYTGEFENELNFEEYYGEDNWNSDDSFYTVDDRVSWSHIDLGNNYYFVIYGYDEDGNTTWTYETEKCVYTEDMMTTTYLGCYDKAVVFVVDNGKIVALDYDEGTILWKFDDSLIINPLYDMRDDGVLYVVYNDNTSSKSNIRLLIIDIEGNIIAAKNLGKENSELANKLTNEFFIEFNEDEIALLHYKEDSQEFFIEDSIIHISLKDYSVNVEELETKNVKKEDLIGKTLIADFGSMYYFNKDGTYQEITDSNYIEKYTVLRKSGTWSIKNDVIKLTVTDEVIAEGGHYEYDSGDRILVDYEEKNISVNNEEYEYQIIYYPNYRGQEMIMLDGMWYSLVEPVG